MPGLKSKLSHLWSMLSTSEKAGWIAGIVPFFAHISHRSIQTMDGWITEVYYRDFLDIGLGIMAVLAALFALIQVGKIAPSNRMKRIGGIVILILLGVFHTLSGFGMFYKPVTEDAKLPSSATDWYKLGSAYFSREKYKEAGTAFSKAITFDSNYAAAYNARGGIYRYMGEYARAVHDYNKVLELNPDYVNARFAIGRIYLIEGQIEDATRELEKVVRQDPKNFIAYKLLGEIATQKQEYEKAAELFGAAYKLKPDDPETKVMLDYIGSLLGRDVIPQLEVKPAL